MIQLTETYTWKQAATMNKLKKLNVKLEMISFAIEGKIEDLYLLSQQAALEGMVYFDEKLEAGWQTRKDGLLAKFPKFDFNKRLRYKIEGEPVGTQISFEEFVGIDYKNGSLDYRNYINCDLPYVLLEPPYSLNLKINHEYGTPEYNETKAKEYSTIYDMFLNDFVLLSEYKEDDFIIYSWSGDWSNFFDAGKEWWGTYYCTVYNKRNNTIIVLGASETD